MSVVDRLEAVGVDLADSSTAHALGSWSSTLRTRYRLFAVGSDMVVAAAVFLGLGTYVEASTVAVGTVGAVGYVAATALAGGYDPRRAASGLREYRGILRGGTALIVLAMALAFAGVVHLPALPVLLAVSTTALTSALMRTAQRKLLSAVRASGALRSRAVLVAAPDRAASIARSLLGVHPGLQLVGACVADAEIGSEIAAGVNVLGAAEDATVIAEKADVDVVLVSPGAMGNDEFRKFRWALESSGKELMIVPDVNEVLSGRLDVQVVGATPLLNVRLRQSRAQRLTKAAMDRVLGATLLVMAAPIILAGMIAVRLDSPGAAIFRQVRIGQEGRPFTMFKLRTMTNDAERRRSALIDSNEGAGPLFKMTADPRVTAVGRILRRFSLDELPQLWNVVRGDMSLVGPRPPLASEVATYDSMAVHRLHVKPGLTGLWQVSGRSDLTWEQSVRLDLRYVDNWSIGFDLMILWRTAAAVLGARGAY